MGIGTFAPSPFLNVSLLTLQAFEVFHLQDAHRTRQAKAFGKAQRRRHSLAIIQSIKS